MVAGRIAALFARTGPPRDGHGPIEAVSAANGYTKTDEILRIEGEGVLARSLEDFFTELAR